ncbi:MAG TPA: hypothetical protein VGO43_01705, partial [Pyrinomonadaceae bacterium]|nr:hypothetical protein [Pyrinomonadaceae bacterium]
MVKKKRGKEQDPITPLSSKVVLAISAAAALIYFFSNPRPQSFYDYTFRVAANMLGGKVAFNLAQPTWLNEFVPFEGYYYSVFPLGAVVSMLPFAVLKAIGLITEMPGAWIATILAGAICWFCLKIAAHYQLDNTKRIMLSLAIVFGTFMWTNLSFAGAWQLALGFAMLGELGAIYFTVFDRRPILAGLFFAMAFGNRTECLLTAPILIYFLYRDTQSESSRTTENPVATAPGSDTLRRVALFCSVPFVLGIATLAYNYIRFHSIADFGYARIPGVLDEPWYNHGIFSTYYIPRQAWEMLLKLWNWRSTFPYFVPDGFSSSIL